MLPNRHSSCSYRVAPSVFVILLAFLLSVVSSVPFFSPSFLSCWSPYILELWNTSYVAASLPLTPHLFPLGSCSDFD